MYSSRDRQATLTKLRIPKASELFAEQILAAILLGELPEGTALPSEKELVAQTGVSRATVREGLRLLEAEGLISTRAGRGGGATVRRPSPHAHTRSLALLLQFDGTTLSELFEAWRALVPLCGRLAAERIRPEEIAELRALLDDMAGLTDDPEAYLAGQVRFHLLIGHATDNAVLRIYALSLAELAYQQIQQVRFAPQDLLAGLIACRAILEALEQRDGEKAERRIAKHLAAIEADIDRLGMAPAARPTELAGVMELLSRGY